MIRFLLSSALLLVGMILCVISLATPVELTAVGSLSAVVGIVISSTRDRTKPAKPYLSADTVEEMEIECYIGPYAEPFRAESLKAREAAKRKRAPVRVVEPCEREDETAHIFAMNGRCVLCGTFPPRTPEYAPVKLDGDTLADCLGDPNRDHHWWRTFRDLEGFHSKCLHCGVRQERTKVFG